ncbi:peroxynitrite isomerase THAP4 [Discoglossus pictus]
MVICCAAPNCTNRQGKGKRGTVSFHRFPLKDPARLTQWTDALQRSNWTPGPYSFLCSDHFSPDNFVPRMPDQHPLLKPSAVPCIFQGSRENKKRGVTRQCVLGVAKRKKLTKKRPFSINQEDISGNQALTESTSQTSIIISDDFKDSSCLLISGVSTSTPTACKFISSLHSYSSSSKSSSISLRETAMTVLPPTMDMRTDNICEQPSYAETNLSSYVEVSGVFPSQVEASGDFHCHIQDSNKNSSGNEPPQTLPHYIDVHCESSELSQEEAKEPRHLTDERVTYPLLEEECDSYSLQAINSLHSYCCSSQKPLSSRRNHLRKKTWQTDRPTEEQRWNTSIPTAQGSPPLHPAVTPLSWMLGSWVSEPTGEGEFPTIQPFRYTEEVSITHAGQPMLNFMFWASNPETGKALHRESGFIRIKPGTNHVAFICAQNLGIVEIEEGEVQGQQLCLSSQSISRTSFASEPYVEQISRTFRLTPEGKLEQTVSMATSNQPLTPHLHVTYRKVTS